MTVGSRAFCVWLAGSELWVAGTIGVLGSLALVEAISFARWPDRTSLASISLSHFSLASIDFVGVDLDRWRRAIPRFDLVRRRRSLSLASIYSARSLSLVRLFFFFVLSLSFLFAVLCFLSLSLCVFQATEME